MELAMNLSASIVIPRPREEVFAFISRVENMPRWVTGVLSARLDSGEMSPGATFTCEYRQGLRSDSVQLEVVAYEPPRKYGTRTSRAPFQFEGMFHLESIDEGTLVTNTIEAGPDSLSSKLATMLLGRLLQRSMRKRLRRELDALEVAIAG